MTTATTTTVIDHSSDAAFRTWVAEIITQLLAVGITQTADTGQINTTTVTRPAINVMAGYVIMRFNDTAQGTSPIFFKLEFGTSSGAAEPNMLLTVGTASNGAGTLTGTTTTRLSIVGGTHSSSVITYVSRFCYNATDGILAMSWKINGVGGTNANLGTLIIARTTDSSGASTTNAYLTITNNSTTAVGGAGTMQIYSYTAAALVALASATLALNGPSNGNANFNSGGNVYVIPFYFQSPVPGVHGMIAFACVADIAIGVTVTLALVGSTTHTFVSVGSFFGNNSVAGITTGTWLMIWE